MRDEHLKELLENIRQDADNNLESQNEIFENYMKEVTYYYAHVLVFEKNLTKFVNSTFDKLFKRIKSSIDEINANDFYFILNGIMFEECNNRLEEYDRDYKKSWSESSFDFITNYDELKPGSVEDSVLYSENCKLYVLNMLKDLPNNERIIAYSYYFLDMTVERMAEIICVDTYDIEKFLKSIRFNIETNIKFANNTQETVLFTKQTIKTYLLYDFNNQIQSYDNSLPKQYNLPQKNDVYVSQSNNQFKQAENNNKKQSLLLFGILAIVVLIIAAVVVLSIKYILVNNTNETTQTTSTTIPETPVTDIQISQNPLYLKVGESVVLDYIITPSNATTNDLTKMVDSSLAKDSNADWCYKIQDDSIIKYDPNTKKITALKAGNSQFRVFSLRYENSEDNLISCLIFVYVTEKDVNLTLSESSVSIKPGETAKINYTITPDSSSHGVIWSSSNESVAKVDDGIITGVGSGTCTITANIINSNVTKSVSVTVTAETVNVDVTASFVTAKSAKVKVGDVIDLSFNATPSKEYVKLDIMPDQGGNSSYEYNAATGLFKPLVKTRYVIKLANSKTNVPIQVIVFEAE